MATFDVSIKANQVEVQNALAQVKKEIAMYPNFKFSAKASVNDRVVSEARLTMAFRDVGMGQGLDFMGFFFKGMQK